MDQSASVGGAQKLHVCLCISASECLDTHTFKCRRCSDDVFLHVFACFVLSVFIRFAQICSVVFGPSKGTRATIIAGVAPGVFCLPCMSISSFAAAVAVGLASYSVTFTPSLDWFRGPPACEGFVPELDCPDCQPPYLPLRVRGEAGEGRHVPGAVVVIPSVADGSCWSSWGSSRSHSRAAAWTPRHRGC